MAEKSGKTGKRSSALTKVLILVCIGILLFSGYKVISIQMNYKKAQEEYSSLRQYTHAQEAEPEEASKEETEEPEAADEDESSEEKSTHGSRVGSKKHLKAPITVDHEALLAQNPDYAGWLYIGALDLGYPVMKGEDEEYYLHHTFDGSYLFAGSLFINSDAKKDFSDPHTLVYGHNMKDGSMFGSLRSVFYEQGRYTDDPTFWILTPQGDYRYCIFAMYTCQDTSDTYTIFSGHGEIVADYIKAMKAKSLVDMGEIEYDEQSKVVTLSTCVQAEGSERFVVQGVRDN